MQMRGSTPWMWFLVCGLSEKIHRGFNHPPTLRCGSSQPCEVPSDKCGISGQSSVPISRVANVLLLAVLLISRNADTALHPNCCLGACFYSYLFSLSLFLTAELCGSALWAPSPLQPWALPHTPPVCPPPVLPSCCSQSQHAALLLPKGSENTFVKMRSN